jgi:hypothetical protein
LVPHRDDPATLCGVTQVVGHGQHKRVVEQGVELHSGRRGCAQLLVLVDDRQVQVAPPEQAQAFLGLGLHDARSQQRGEDAVVLSSDAVLNALQVVDPQLAYRYDDDPEAARASRLAHLTEPFRRL